MLGHVRLDLAREHRPDLILLDLHLPGERVLTGLRSDPVTRDILVAVLSADATRDTLETFAAGARAYLTKPTVLRRLLETLDQFLAGVPGDQTAQPEEEAPASA